MNKARDSSIIEKLLLLLTGYLGLSTLSTQIFSMLHLPYLIELFFIPIILFYTHKNGTLKTYMTGQIHPLFLFYILFLILSTWLGIIDTGDIANVVTCIRPFVYMSLIIFCCAKKKVAFPLENIYLVVIGCLFGELSNKLIFMSGLSSIDHINTFALAVFVIIPFIIKNIKMILFSSIFGLLMAVLTLYRREIVIYVIALISGILYFVMTQRSYKKAIYTAGIGVLGYYIYINAENILLYIINLFNLDNTSTQALSATYRIIEKFKTADYTSDLVRLNTWNKIFTDFQDRLFPRGPVGKAYGLWYFGAYTDSTNIFLYDVFGSVLAWIFVAVILVKAFSCIYNVVFKKVQDPEMILSALMVPTFLACMAMDGTFMVHANISIIAGYALHGWFIKSRNTQVS